ncbi:MotA/TolQ/ExbB proton channel family protein [Methanobrevibacter curvatus]|uniref:MotA/TolQ/ExbB proton channel family protein n=1 Tax=Methanobrevibacter curvatus TaxID=49547 RepID=A0A166DRA6_9EURY|nr:MotA/TolQ/ExbB proton channel family protein [Methanobrevibacter curvatus]KZX15872.1 MotA/TolQ/ExbB proton channel family protein [Methanobrevibacter curvatus]
MEIIGSQILSQLLHAISQSLLIPVIIVLVLFVVYALISLGGFISEYSTRRKFKISNMEDLIRQLRNSTDFDQMKDIVKDFSIAQFYKDDLIKAIDTNEFSVETRKALASKLIEKEEIRMEKSVEKTDTVVRIGPTLGLMGTLIPMGPGLAALGAGDIQGLAQAIIVAFDTTVAGLAAATISYVVSRVRKRWYEEDLSNLDVLITSTLEIVEEKLN